MTPVGDTDLFLADLSGTGDVVWALRAGGTGASTDPRFIGADASHRTYVAGYCAGQCTFGATVVTDGNFLLTVTPSGAIESARVLAIGDTVTDVTVDAEGDVFVAGTFSGTVHFADGDVVTKGSTDVFVVKYRPDGSEEWHVTAGGPGTDEESELALAPDGTAVWTGQYGTGMTLGGQPLSGWGMFVARLDAHGAVRWQRGFERDLAAAEIFAAAVDSHDNVIIAGYFESDAFDFGDGPILNHGTQQWSDAFVAKLDRDGKLLWSGGFGSDYFDSAMALTVDDTDAITVAGQVEITATYDACTFGPGAVVLRLSP